MINNNLRQMLTLQQLADYRCLTIISFRIAKRKLEAVITTQGASPDLDDMILKCKLLVDTVEEIDACFREYFLVNGRLN